MPGMKTWLTVLVLAAVALGCNSTKKSFEVEVTNQTNTPVTLWLMKEGPPPEEGWRSPEELALLPEGLPRNYDLAFVSPGKTGYTPRLAGEFPDGTHAVLRVYEGEKELFHILQETKAGTVKRIDHKLRPGKNRLTLVDRAGQMAIEPR